MAGAERQGGLDLQGEVVRPHGAAVVAAVDEEAAGPHGREAEQRTLHPVLLRDVLRGRGCGHLPAHRVGEERADPCLLDAAAEVDLHDPGPGLGVAGLVLEGRGGRLGGVEDLHHDVGGGAGASLVAGEPQELRGVVGRQAFEHARG